MEIIMVITLAIMGVYFFKSTELPKDLKERSAMLQAESNNSTATNKTFRMTIPKMAAQTTLSDRDLDAKLTEMKLQKNLVEIKLINAEIDKLTLLITTLEQEIRVNNERNNEIHATIETHLISLQALQEKITKLS